jgi:hypothetical protein
MPPKLAAIFNRPRQDTPPAYIASFCRIELSSKFGNSIGALLCLRYTPNLQLNDNSLLRLLHLFVSLVGAIKQLFLNYRNVNGDAFEGLV